MLEILKFETIYKDKLWGGQKIKTILGKDFGDLPNCGETWEISGVEGDISVVASGPLQGSDLKSLIRTFKEELVGESVYGRFGDEFPLLIKFIDANQDLSIQVHPDDKLAQERHGSFGKTEMWYVLQADEGASLISGFNQPVDREKYLTYFNSGRLMELLNRESVVADDVFFLPAGRVHTIGKGLLIAEIQQTSDVTYRIYDFDRRDAHGNMRELHVEQALDAIDYAFVDEYKTRYSASPDTRTELVTCPYFTTNKLMLEDHVHHGPDTGSFVIYVCLEGEASISYSAGQVTLVKGDVVLVPAAITNFEIETSVTASLLETYIPD